MRRVREGKGAEPVSMKTRRKTWGRGVFIIGGNRQKYKSGKIKYVNSE